ncbi:MAG: GIY-YIG nuclease family protein [Candidatus Aureabacteria bacterium]|nr:GIY-YIG nuclease family protein [Candidatus Auribacterota bacterium]
MYYVYILQSERDNNLYIGYTNNLKERILLHNTGKVFSTKNRTPLQLIYYEAFMDKKDASEREKWLKTGWGHNQIRKILSNYLNNKNL